MVVRDRVGRKRYILLRQDSLKAIRPVIEDALGDLSFRLSHGDPPYTIIRVDHRVATRAREALNAHADLTTLLTSGTIRTIKERIAHLRERR